MQGSGQDSGGVACLNPLLILPSCFSRPVGVALLGICHFKWQHGGLDSVMQWPRQPSMQATRKLSMGISSIRLVAWSSATIKPGEITALGIVPTIRDKWLRPVLYMVCWVDYFDATQVQSQLSVPTRVQQPALSARNDKPWIHEATARGSVAGGAQVRNSGPLSLGQRLKWPEELPPCNLLWNRNLTKGSPQWRT